MNYDNYELGNGKRVYLLFEFTVNNIKYIGFTEKIPFLKEDIVVAIEDNNTLLPVQDLEQIQPIIDNLIKFNINGGD